MANTRQQGPETGSNRFGSLLSNYRAARRLTQAQLVEALGGDLKYDAPTISRWEHGERKPPPREVVKRLAEVLSLDPDQTAVFLEAAGYATPSIERISHTSDRTYSEIKEVRQRVEGLYSLLASVGNPAAAPIAPTSSANAAAASLQRVTIPIFSLALAGGLLTTAISGDTSPVVAGLVGLSLGVTGFQGFGRAKKMAGLVKSGLSSEFAGGNHRFGELVFVTVLVCLSLPLVQSTYTGMDLYGLFQIERFDGIALPVFINLAINLVLASVAATTFNLLWLRLPSRFSAIARAAWLSSVPLVLAYVPAALFAWDGSAVFFFVEFALFGLAMFMMISFSDERVRIGLWEARVALSATIAALFVLFILAMVGVVLLYFGPQEPHPGSIVMQWETDKADLMRSVGAGTFEDAQAATDTYASRMQIGMLSSVIPAIAFLLFVDGSVLLSTIYQRQVAPFTPKSAEQLARDLD